MVVTAVDKAWPWRIDTGRLTVIASTSISRARLLRASLTVVAVGASMLAIVAPSRAASLEGIHKIQHVVMIMQENRSYDTYFGTYPGGNGIPGDVCVPDPVFVAETSPPIVPK